MPEQEQQRKNAATSREDFEQEDPTPGASGEQGAQLKAELDDLLDEIDEVLESNAEDFVKSYVQKGGE